MKNLIDCFWKNVKNRNVKINKKNGKLIIENNSDRVAMICCSKLFKKNDNGIKIQFDGNIISGEAVVLELINRKKEIVAETTLNSTMLVGDAFFKYYLVVLKVFPNTKVEINKIDFYEQAITEDDKFSDYTNDILVITPSYPSQEHKYLSGFVHSRVVEYKKNGIDVDVAIVYDYLNTSKYEFEGIKASRMTYLDLRTLITRKKYKKILVHFFDRKYFNVLEGCDLTDTEVFVWVHGPETLYWDYPCFTTGYFEKSCDLSDEQKAEFSANDEMIKKVNDMPNVKFVFVSQWIKDKSEELINIKFKNYEVIPNIIDVDLFDFQEKTADKMKKIFMLRRYDNINKYAVDVSVRTILELSKRPNFDEYEFNIYGNGDTFDKLFKPILGFENVHFHRSFFTHEEIASIHKENGIALFPTRYDAQGVSMCEAGSSGLLVISSENDAIKEFIPYEDGNIIETENFKKYADFIEKVSSDSKLFNKIIKDTRKKIVDKCSYDSTVKKEIEMIKKGSSKEYYSVDLSSSAKPVLSIIIPSYNVAKYVVKTIKSLVINNKNASKLEILVVNDGSKDNTVDVVNDFIKKYSDGKDCVVKLIDKENGGHGSTINVGISKATGKYLRIIDGDDWVDTKQFEKLIDILDKEDSDIVVTNYSEDLYAGRTVKLNKVNLYDSMQPGFKYDFDDLCYEGYGFNNWGPILSTANIKLSKLKEANFKLSEKTFYVDMEYNTYYLPFVDTITYYDLDIYRYFIGRPQQSVSLTSFVKNIKHHERVINNVLTYTNDTAMSDAKKKYIYEKLALPMIKVHYSLLTDIIKKRKEFKNFDKIVREKLPSSYDDFGKRISLLRKLNGNFIRAIFFVNRSK